MILSGANGRRLEIGPAHPRVMGILNLTPDSFSDGGVHATESAALEAAARMEDDGATVLDLGAESTRPGAAPVSADEECDRLLPVLDALRERTDLFLSVDTSKAEVARRALELGADMINDVTALRGDPEMAAVVAEHRVPVVLMHMRGEPRTMQDAPHYDDVVAEVLGELLASVDTARDAGIEQILLDPGIGFGKRLEDNRALLQNLDRFVSTGMPLLLGVSRKSLLGPCLTRPGRETPPPDARDAATLALVCEAWHYGVAIHRVHNVRYAVDALRTLEAFGRKKT